MIILLILLSLIVSMACRSLVHTLLHHYNQFAEKFKIKNRQWWNPAVSWTNKYNSDGTRNKKILQFSDAFHFFNMIELGAYVFAITLGVWFRPDLAWWWFLIIFGVIGLIVILSFNIFYDKIWR